MRWYCVKACNAIVVTCKVATLLLAIAATCGKVHNIVYCYAYFCLPVTSQEAEDDLVNFKKAGLSTAQNNARKND